MPEVLVIPIPGHPRGWAMRFILIHFPIPNKIELNVCFQLNSAAVE